MKNIFKYKLNDFTTVINLPEGSEILSAQKQEDNFMLWCLVDDDSLCPTEKRQFICLGTGQGTLDFTNIKHISTIQSGVLVFHIFENLNFESNE